MSLMKSSHDPAKISLTVKGLAVFIPSIVVLASYFGIDLSPDTLGELVNYLAATTGSLMTIWGLVRKLWAPENPPSN